MYIENVSSYAYFVFGSIPGAHLVLFSSLLTYYSHSKIILQGKEDFETNTSVLRAQWWSFLVEYSTLRLGPFAFHQILNFDDPRTKFEPRSNSFVYRRIVFVVHIQHNVGFTASTTEQSCQ